MSRFTANGLQIEYGAAIILSGQEPSRSKLENQILQQASDCRYRFILVRGVEEPHHFDFPNIKVRSLVCTNSLQEIFDKSNIVICRPGYSSVMDLTNLRKRVILIPTPGQTEQEYIVKRLKGKDGLVVQREDQIRLEEAMAQLLS